jgi:hypothetical protein
MIGVNRILRLGKALARILGGGETECIKNFRRKSVKCPIRLESGRQKGQ